MHSEFRLEKKHKNEILYRHYDLFRRKERKKERNSINSIYFFQ